MILFPTVVTLPDGQTFKACKVYYSPSGVDVWWWDGTKAIVVASGQTLEEVDRQKQWTFQVQTSPVAGLATIVKDPDCGCSHPLTYFRPAAPVVG